MKLIEHAAPSRPLRLRIISALVIVPFLILSLAVSQGAPPGRNLPPAAVAADRDCGDCEREDAGGGDEPVGIFCSFQYIIYFLWYAVMAVVFVVALVMDLTTAFTQDYTKEFVKWFRDKNAGLSSFFRSVGCG